MAADPALTQLMFDFNAKTKQRRTTSEVAYVAVAQIADQNPVVADHISAAYEAQLFAALHGQALPSITVEDHV